MKTTKGVLIPKNIIKRENDLQIVPFKKGQTLAPPDHISDWFKGAAKELKNVIRPVLQTLEKRVNELNTIRKEKKEAFIPFLEKIKKGNWRIQTVDRAQKVMSPKPWMALAYIFFILEGLTTYFLSRNFLGDNTPENQMKALLWTLGILVGTIVFKKIIPLLHRNLKYLIFGVFITSLISFGYLIVTTQAGDSYFDLLLNNQTQDEAITTNGPDEKDALKSFSEKTQSQDMATRAALLVIFLSGGLSIAALVRDPLSERQSKEILDNADAFLKAEKKKDDTKEQIDTLKEMYESVDQSPLELELIALNRAQLGVGSLKTRIFRGSDTRAIYESELISRKKEIEIKIEEMSNQEALKNYLAENNNISKIDNLFKGEISENKPESQLENKGEA